MPQLILETECFRQAGKNNEIFIFWQNQHHGFQATN